jgi:release factor glutamine methyltransferase
MCIETIYRDIQSSLDASGIENSALEARWILKEVLGVSDADFITGANFAVLQQQKNRIDEIVSRRKGGEPLSRIFGEREFWGMNFKIGPETLDPRPDTETLVNIVLNAFHVERKPLDILDLGTGSGAILISLLKERPHAHGVGVDKSWKTLDISLHNSKLLGVEQRSSWICGDWADSVNGKFDIVVSNPPYIRTDVIANLDVEVRNHDPILALDGGGDGLQAYKKIFSDLPRLLKTGGLAFLEIGFDQADEISRLAVKYRIRVNAIHPDAGGRPRVLEITCGDK